jgi:hypothetical protein
LFDQQLRISQGMGNAAEDGLGRATQMMDTNWDSSVLPNRVDYVNSAPMQTSVEGAGDGARNAVVQALMARQQPGMDQRREAEQNKLITQGHSRGGTAWNSTQDDLARSENDARFAAEIAGGQEQSRQFGMNLGAGQFANQAQQQDFSQDMANAGLQNTGRQNMLQEQMFLRQLPLNELNALRTGAQVGQPQFQQYGQQQAVPGANYSGAAQATGLYDQNAYNQGVSQNNGMMSGLFGLGAAALGMPPGLGMAAGGLFK